MQQFRIDQDLGPVRPIRHTTSATCGPEAPKGNSAKPSGGPSAARRVSWASTASTSEKVSPEKQLTTKYMAATSGGILFMSTVMASLSPGGGAIMMSPECLKAPANSSFRNDTVETRPPSVSSRMHDRSRSLPIQCIPTVSSSTGSRDVRIRRSCSTPSAMTSPGRCSCCCGRISFARTSTSSSAEKSRWVPSRKRWIAPGWVVTMT
mmetsp:Transcript_123580/g.214350  ORF Transcript_123580/g.214350 Transcript_123580/m.214350 type:complete len:207 (+) Transcript_123580:146-766(+)